MSLERWISTHPYLRPVADFSVQLSEATTSVPLANAHIPNWQGYADDYRAGIPLLKSLHATIDSAEAGRIVLSVLEKLTSIQLPKKMERESLELYREFRREPGKPGQLVSWLLGTDTWTLPHPGLCRHIGWTALARYLGRLLAAFENWRDEESWMQPYCPFCGSGPSMAQLIGADPGRRRFLACGCCRARWQFRRIECPFCENVNDHQLSVLAIESERQLRIDYCHSCRGYLKTYDGEGCENVMLADWTSLHLDLLAQDRGLKRFASSLYEL
jgi:FdhE protein